MENNFRFLINFLRTIWNYGGSVLFGGLITALFSYKFTKWRENQRLKIDIQVKTTEQLIEFMKVFQDASSSLLVPVSYFKNYNITLQYNQVTNDFGRNQIEKAKENIQKSMQSYMELWQIYFKALITIISILESKEIILNKFIGFKDILLAEHDKIGKIHNDIMHLYQFDINHSTVQSMPIEECYLLSLDSYEKELMEKIADIVAIMWDLNVGLQNEFLSELFKYKVPLRQPQDKSLPVYVPGFVYKAEENSQSS